MRRWLVFLLLVGLGLAAFIIGYRTQTGGQVNNHPGGRRANPVSSAHHSSPPPAITASPESSSAAPQPLVEAEASPAFSPSAALPVASSSTPAAHPRAKARIAIIIDDLGNSREMAAGFIDAPMPLTLAVLPLLPGSADIAGQARQSGKTVILHLPLENASGINPGPGTIRVGMKPGAIKEQVAVNLESVPGAEGVNSHEGSRATTDLVVMKTIIQSLGERRLYFIDSRTTPDSLGETVARLEGVPFARRHVFLDNQDNVSAIREQIRQLGQLALIQGSALGIGHARPATLEALKVEVPILETEGIFLVPARELVRIHPLD